MKKQTVIEKRSLEDQYRHFCALRPELREGIPAFRRNAKSGYTALFICATNG